MDYNIDSQYINDLYINGLLTKKEEYKCVDQNLKCM